MSIMLPSIPAALAFAASSNDEPRKHRYWFMSSPDPTPSSDDRRDQDAELIRRMAGLDKAACAELYDRFSRPLYATALQIVRDEKEAEDILQEVFLTLWEKASGFEPERGTAFGWAVTLTRNRAIDRIRTRRRRAEILENSAEEFQPAARREGESTGQLVSKEEATAVRAAVATLPPEQKQALELAFFSGFTQQEIARQLSEPLGTIKARIRRGLLKLRDALGQRHD